MTVFGVGFNAQLNQGYDLNKHCKAIRDLGCREVRYGLSWRNVAAQTSGFNWTEPDAVVGKCAQYGLRVLPIIYRTPAWIGATNDPPPPDLYADFVARVARRYGAYGEFWNIFWRSNPGKPAQAIMAYEIWNEQNWLTADWRGSDEQYGMCYRAAHNALKALNPRYEAIVGGIAYPQGDEWLRANWNRLEPVDAVGWHPYGLSVVNTYAMIGDMVNVLEDVGHPKVPIDITEIGLPVGWVSPHFTESDRANYLRNMAASIQTKKHVRRFNVYTWFPEEANWNIARADATLKKGAVGYRQGIAA